jgi:predicted MFS family arabinose efflux permease
MIGAAIGRLIALCMIPLAWALGTLELWLLFAVATLIGLLSVLFHLAERAYLPELVGPSRLLDGNATLILGEGAARVAGPPLVGIVIQSLGAPLTLLVDTATYGASALCLGRIQEPRTGGVTPRVAEEGVGSAMGEGLRFVLRHPLLRSILAINVLGNLGMGMVDGVALVFAYQQLHLSPVVVGMAMGAGGGGFLVAAFVTGRLTRWLGVGPTLAMACVLYALAPAALVAGAFGFAMAGVLLWRLLYGISLPPYDVNAATIRQAATPDHLQGRALAAINTFGWGALGLGPLVGGVLGPRLGMLPTILLGAAICLVGALPAFAPSVRRLHDPMTPRGRLNAEYVSG